MVMIIMSVRYVAILILNQITIMVRTDSFKMETHILVRIVVCLIYLHQVTIVGQVMAMKFKLSHVATCGVPLR